VTGSVPEDGNKHLISCKICLSGTAMSQSTQLISMPTEPPQFKSTVVASPINMSDGPFLIMRLMMIDRKTGKVKRLKEGLHIDEVKTDMVRQISESSGSNEEFNKVDKKVDTYRRALIDAFCTVDKAKSGVVDVAAFRFLFDNLAADSGQSSISERMLDYCGLVGAKEVPYMHVIEWLYEGQGIVSTT